MPELSENEPGMQVNEIGLRVVVSGGIARVTLDALMTLEAATKIIALYDEALPVRSAILSDT